MKEYDSSSVLTGGGYCCSTTTTNNENGIGYEKVTQPIYEDKLSLMVADEQNFSYFDFLLVSEWRKAMRNGAFKFKLDSPLPTRHLGAKFNFVVQLNPKRYFEKRPSEIKKTTNVSQDFDLSRFNFTRINENEVLFQVEKNHLNKLCLSRKGSAHNNDKSESFIIINNSPIELAHSLIVPQLRFGLQQVLNEEAIELTTRLSLLSGSFNIIFGFNSLNAYSSVNHLHLHIYYLSCFDRHHDHSHHHSQRHSLPFPIQNITHAELVTKNLWFINDENYFFPAFSLQLSDFNNDVVEFSKNVWKITNYLIVNNMPHNFVLVKAETFKSSCRAKNSKQNENNNSIQMTTRAVIWPKKQSYDVPANLKSVVFAMCELSGHFLIPNEDVFENITEADIIELAKLARLESDKLALVKRDLENLFCEHL